MSKGEARAHRLQRPPQALTASWTTRGRAKATRPEVDASIDERIRLFAKSAEEVTADQVQGIFFVALERDVVYLCAMHMLAHHPRMYLQVHAALQEI